MTDHGARRRSVFRNRNFMLLFSGKVISMLGDQVYAFALSWYILSITKSSFQMSLFLFTDALAVALVAPFGGVVADRLNRKAILVWMDLLRCLVVLAAALLLYERVLQIWMLYVNAIVLGCCGAIFNPAAGAIIPNVVDDEELAGATSMNQFSWSFCGFVGMMAGGFLFNLIGIFAIFILNAGSFLVSAGLEARVELRRIARTVARPAATLRSEAGRVLRELVEGYRYVRGKALIFMLILIFAIYNLILLPVGFVCIPYFFNVALKASPYQLALSTGSVFIGMMAASLLVPLFLKKYRLRSALFWGLLVLCASQLVMVPVLCPPLRAYFDNWRLTYFISFVSLVMGTAMTFFNIPITIIFQNSCADDYRGRFWGFYSSITSLVIPFAYVLGGFLAQRIPIVLIFGASGSLLLLVDLWVVNIRELRELGE
jgi:MFS transporter, DHA3 family, macrolide efflux protein